MKTLYTVEYRSIANPEKIVTKTVTIEASGANTYWFLDTETEKTIFVRKERIIDMRKHGAIDMPVEL